MAMGHIEAFRALGAKLRNSQWSFSALAEDGAVVITCWTEFFEPAGAASPGEGGLLRYRDNLHRVAHNRLGHAEARALLDLAWRESRPLRAVLARPVDRRLLAARRAAQADNRFEPRPDLVGRLVAYDGDAFVIELRSAA